MEFFMTHLICSPALATGWMGGGWYSVAALIKNWPLSMLRSNPVKDSWPLYLSAPSRSNCRRTVLARLQHDMPTSQSYHLAHYASLIRPWVKVRVVVGVVVRCELLAVNTGCLRMCVCLCVFVFGWETPQGWATQAIGWYRFRILLNQPIIKLIRPVGGVFFNYR